MTSTVVAVIAGDGRLDDARVVDVHDIDVDRVARVAVRRRRLVGEGRRVPIERVPPGPAAISEMPRDGFPHERAQFLVSHDRSLVRLGR